MADRKQIEEAPEEKIVFKDMVSVTYSFQLAPTC